MLGKVRVSPPAVSYLSWSFHQLLYDIDNTDYVEMIWIGGDEEAEGSNSEWRKGKRNQESKRKDKKLNASQNAGEEQKVS